MRDDVFEFVIYMIHTCANRWNKLPSEVYQKMQAAGCIQDFLVRHYDVLHTQSSAYVAEDIREYLENRGVSIYG